MQLSSLIFHNIRFRLNVSNFLVPSDNFDFFCGEQIDRFGTLEKRLKTSQSTTNVSSNIPRLPVFIRGYGT